MAAGYFDRVLQALDIAYNDKPADLQVREQSHVFLEQISNDVSQLPHCWNWFLDLTSLSRTTPVAQQYDRARFWCLQTCDKLVKVKGDDLQAVRVQIAGSFCEDYLSKFLFKQDVDNNVEEVEYIVNRAVSVYVALITMDYPHRQPDLIQKLINLITSLHTSATTQPTHIPIPNRALIAAIGVFLRCMTQLNDLYLTDIQGTQTLEERDCATRVKDGMRDVETTKWIKEILASVVSGSLFGLTETITRCTGECVEMPAWWIDLSVRALAVLAKFSVWIDLVTIRDPSFQLFYTLALTGRLPLQCAEATTQAIRGLAYKRMHPLAKLSLVKDYGVVELLNQGAQLGMKAPEDTTAFTTYGQSLAMAITVAGTQIIESLTYCLNEMKKLEVSKAVLQFNNDELNQFRHSGLTQAPSYSSRPEFIQLGFSLMHGLFGAALRLFLSTNLQASEGVGAFLKDCFKAIKYLIDEEGSAPMISRQHIYTMVGQMLSGCFQRIRFPDTVTPTQLSEYTVFELDEDDGSVISEFFVCRKISCAIINRVFGIAVKVDVAIALQFLEIGIQKSAESGNWRDLEAFLTLFTHMMDSWRDNSPESTTILRAIVSVLFKLGDQIITQTNTWAQDPELDFIQCSYIDCVSKSLNFSRLNANDWLEVHPRIISLITDVVLSLLEHSRSRRLAKVCIKCICRSNIPARQNAKFAPLSVHTLVDRLLRNTEYLHLKGIENDSRIMSNAEAFFRDCGTGTPYEYYDNICVSTEEQVKLYEFIGELLSTHKSKEENSAQSTEIRHRLYQAALHSQATLPQLQTASQVELTSRQLRCIGYLMKCETNAGVLRDSRDLVTRSLTTFANFHPVLSASIPLMRMLCTNDAGNLTENLQALKLMLAAYQRQLQSPSYLEATAYEQLMVLTKMASFYCTVTTFFAEAICNQSSRQEAMAFVRLLITTLYRQWQSIVGGSTHTKSASTSDSLWQIIQIYISLLNGAAFCSANAVNTLPAPRLTQLHSEAACLLMFEEVVSGVQTTPTLRLIDLLEFLDVAQKDSQVEAIVKGYMQVARNITAPDIIASVPRELFVRMDPNLAMCKLLALNTPKVSEHIGVITKFLIQGISLDQPDQSARVIPDIWRTNGSAASEFVQRLEPYIQKATTKNQAREIVLRSLVGTKDYKSLLKT